MWVELTSGALRPLWSRSEIRSPKSERRPKSEIRRCARREECLPAGKSSDSTFEFQHRRGSAFTLIELILVMAILTMAVSVTAPTLANFFRGRTLDSEARRLLALTRSGQNRAAAEGIPIDLWVDPTQGIIGLDAEPSFETGDPKSVVFNLDSGVQIEVVKKAVVASATMVPNPLRPTATASVPRVNLTHSALPTIRFLPDGTVSETSPTSLRLSGRDGVSVWVALAQDKLSYEIRRTEQ